MEIGYIENFTSFQNLDKMDVKTGWSANAGKLISPANNSQPLQFTYVSGLWKWKRKITVNKKSFKIQIFGTAGNFNSEFYIDGSNKLCSFFSYDSSVLQSADALVLNNGDLLEFGIEKNEWTYLILVKNLTTNQTVSLTASNINIPIHKLRFCCSEITEVSAYSFESSQEFEPDTLVVGDSITYGSIASNPSLTWVSIAGFERVCGAGDRSSDALLLQHEILNIIKPKRLIYAMGTNDSVIDNWKSALSTFKSICGVNRITFIPFCPYANNVRSMQAHYDYIVANFNVYFDLWTVTKQPSNTNMKPEYNSGDNVHPNTLGHYIIGNAVLNSAFYNYFQDFNSFLIKMYYQILAS